MVENQWATFDIVRLFHFFFGSKQPNVLIININNWNTSKKEYEVYDAERSYIKRYKAISMK